jgi:hypothetical protein
MTRAIGLCWFTGLAVVGLPYAASAQVYCSKWAEVVDAPTNIRKSPSSQSALVCQLPRNGMRLLVYPSASAPNHQASRWYATLACQPGPQRRAIGLGNSPAYVHQSQVHLLTINRDDWLGDPEQPGKGACASLWSR